jgi:hypothetical protein
MKNDNDTYHVEGLYWDGTKSGKNRIMDIFSGIVTTKQEGHILLDEMSYWSIATIDGSKQVLKNGYIVKDSLGNYYPYSLSVFEFLYKKEIK